MEGEDLQGERESYRYGDDETDCYTCCHCHGGLAVMLAGEEFRVSESSIGADNGELRTAEDGIGLEGARFEQAHLGGGHPKVVGGRR